MMLGRYASSAFVPLDEVLENPNYHPCLKQTVRDLIKANALATLVAAAAHDASASGAGASAKTEAQDALLAAARTFVAAHHAASPAAEVTKVKFIGGKYEYM